MICGCQFRSKTEQVLRGNRLLKIQPDPTVIWSPFRQERITVTLWLQAKAVAVIAFPTVTTVKAEAAVPRSIL